MLAADIPTWLAALGLTVPALTALLTQLIANWSASKRFDREVAERAKVRAEEARMETWRSDRGDKIELYRKLILAARKLLLVDQPLTGRLLSLKKVVSEGKPLRRRATIEVIDEWSAPVSEVELIAPRVGPAARAVRQRFDEITREIMVDAHASQGLGKMLDLDKQLAADERSRDVVNALVEACSDDISSMAGRG